LIELFEANSNSSKPFGVSHILPFDNSITDGTFRSPIHDLNNNLIGKIKGKYNLMINFIDLFLIAVEFLIIRPITEFNPNAEKMIDIKSGVYMGHRGTGVGRRTDMYVMKLS
jgi:hypothetical protein